MKSKLTHFMIIIMVFCLGSIVLGISTNSRYFSKVDVTGTPQLAKTYFGISAVDASSFDITPGETITAQYRLTNQEGSNINENNLQYYLKLVDGSNQETTKVTMTSIGGSYAYQTGKGYGPIDLAYDGTTETKTFTISFQCSSSITARETLNYKIQVYAESESDTNIYTTKTANITFNIKVYNINYYLDGGTNDSGNPSIIKANTTITLNDPTKTGYAFDGWYKESSFTTQVTQLSNVTADVNLYAKWIRYTIAYTLNGGTNSSNNPSTYIPSDTITLENPTRSTYEFEGWYENASFTGSKVTTISNRTGNITLYAKWSGPYIYFQMPPDWFNAPNVYVYLVNNDASIKNATWRGNKMTLADSDKNIFKYSLENDSNIGEYTKCIFNYTERDGKSTYRQSVDVGFSESILGKIWVPELYNTSNKMRVFTRNMTHTNPYVYLWNSSTGNNNAAWPGATVTFTEVSEVGYSTIITPGSYNMMKVNNGTGNTNRTGDVPIPSYYRDLTVKISGTSLSRFYYSGSWHSYESWFSTEYDTWKADDYVYFQNAQQEIGYAIGY